MKKYDYVMVGSGLFAGVYAYEARKKVQLCERALTSLKYFCEDAPDYHIIVAGSLLGVAVNR